MKLEFRNDQNLMVSDKEPGSYFNATDKMVLLRMPDVAELRQLWADFNRELRLELKDLLVCPYGEIVEKLGKLGFRNTTVEERADTLFGMLPIGDNSAHFKKSALTQAAMALDLVSSTKVSGRAKKRLSPGEGSILENVLAMTREQQRSIIEMIVDNHENLDQWMQVTQGSTVGWATLHKRVHDAADVPSFLAHLAHDTDRLMGDDDSRVVRFSGEAIEFAPSWFSQYLAMRKLWVWPARYSSRMIFLYPARYTPLVARMSVRANLRDFADTIFKYHQDQRNTGAAVSVQAFATVALSGNPWEQEHGPLRWYPLAAFKERIPSFPSSGTLSSSINAVYKLAIEHAGETVKRRPEAHFFVNGARLARIGVDAFNWVLQPTPYNTQVASQLLKRPVTSVPENVRSWATLLRELMPLFEVKNIKPVEHSMSLWLIYLMTIDADGDAPIDFETVSRPDHVHDLDTGNTRTFWHFLNRLPKDNRDRGNRAISIMRRAFALAATKYRFRNATNPFDPKQDKIGKGYKKRSDMTARKPLELEAWELIVRKNREGGYAFARGLGPQRCHFHARNPETGEYENVFWPAEAVAVDIILNSGMRHVSARWVDSGEGDEKRLDREKMVMVENDHPSATLKRNDCFLQLVNLPGKENRKIVGQRVGINKTGKPFVIPWVDEGVIDGFYRMLALQTKYNPISKPVKPIKPKTLEITRANPELFDDIYPLLRDPNGNNDMAISEAKVLSYWKDLLRHCQDDVNKLFGREYPLINEDGLVFDLHALRVTMVSNLLEAGVSIDIVRDLVGHTTWMMTWFYNGFRSAKLNTSVQEAMHMRCQAHDALASGNKAAIEEYASGAVIPDFVGDHVGAEMLRKYGTKKNLAPFDIFLHGICPGGTCSTGGEKYAGDKYQPVWRERACSGCRYRVTGPWFRHGIQNKINNIQAELRMVERRLKDLSIQIEIKEAETGKEDKALHSLQHADSRLKDQLTKELGMELRTQAMAHEVAATAAAQGKSADNLLLPAVPGFDPEKLEFGFAEVSEFELFHTLVKETRILPASIMEIPQGVEAEMKKQLKVILRNNNHADLLVPLSDRQETDACLQIGDALLDRHPEAWQFQQLLEGTVKLDQDLLDEMRRNVNLLLEGMPTSAIQLKELA